MVMETSRAEYLADDKFKAQRGCRESSTSGAEPSSSGASEYILLYMMSTQFLYGVGMTISSEPDKELDT